MTNMPLIAIVGTGRMGSALAGGFLAAGYDVTVWNRTRDKCEPLADQGARIADTILTAISWADIVVVNVNDYETSDRLLHEKEVTTALGRKLLVQLSSGSPAQARAQMIWAETNDIGYLDGVISAPPSYIGASDCPILYAGPEELFEEHKQTLATLGGYTWHVGTDAGSAAALESALLMTCYGAMFGALQGAAICEAAGISQETFLTCNKAFAPAIEGGWVDMINRIQTKRFDADPQSLTTINILAGTVNSVLAFCNENGIQTGVPRAFHELFQQAFDAGKGYEDFASLHLLMRKKEGK